MSKKMNPGIYSANIVSVGTGQASTGTSYIYFECDVTHEAASESEWRQLDEPVRRTVRLYTSDGAWPYTAQKLKGLDFNGDFRSPRLGAETVVLAMDIEEYEGKYREKWDVAPNSGGAREHTKLEAATLLTLNARWKSESGNQQARKPAGPKARTATASNPLLAGPAEDEIPI